MHPVLIDGGDRACGELLLIVHAQIRAEAPGTLVTIRTTDPAATIDIPAWCYLTGHHYLGPVPGPGGPCDPSARHYRIKLSSSARPVRPDRPWRLASPSQESS